MTLWLPTPGPLRSCGDDDLKCYREWAAERAVMEACDMISRCSKKSLVCLVVLISLTGISDALGQSASPEVTVVGNISSHSITMDELLRFTLTFKNKTAFALRS